MGYQIVESLVKQIGGTLEVESTGSGKKGDNKQKSGTVVSIEFKESKYKIDSKLPENIEEL